MVVLLCIWFIIVYMVLLFCIGLYYCVYGCIIVYVVVLLCIWFIIVYMVVLFLCGCIIVYMVYYFVYGYIIVYMIVLLCICFYRGADKSLARPGRKQATATKL